MMILYSKQFDNDHDTEDRLLAPVHMEPTLGAARETDPNPAEAADTEPEPQPRRPRKFKWGACAKCSSAMSPYIFQTGESLG